MTTALVGEFLIGTVVILGCLASLEVYLHYSEIIKKSQHNNFCRFSNFVGDADI